MAYFQKQNKLGSKSIFSNIIKIREKLTNMKKSVLEI